MPGKLLQSSHCFPSWGAGAWESSSFHHKNNPELSKQLPQLPLCISDPEPELPSPLSAEAGTAAPELSARHCEGRPPPRPPPPSARVPHQEPPHPGSMEQGPWTQPADALPDGSHGRAAGGTGTRPQQLCAPWARLPQPRRPIGTLHTTTNNLRTQRHAPLLKPRKQTRSGPGAPALPQPWRHTSRQ